VQERLLAEIGGKGLFAKEIEEAWSPGVSVWRYTR
jgi:porphobilinogen deaminase